MSLLGCSMLHGEERDPDCDYCYPPPPPPPTVESLGFDLKNVRAELDREQRRMRAGLGALGRLRSRFVHVCPQRTNCFACLLDKTVEAFR